MDLLYNTTFILKLKLLVTLQIQTINTKYNPQINYNVFSYIKLYLADTISHTLFPFT